MRPRMAVIVLMAAVIRLVGDATRPEAGQQVVVFPLVTASATASVTPTGVALQVVNAGAADIGGAERAVHVLGHAVPTVLALPALTEELGAVGIGELDEMVVQHAVLRRGGPQRPATLAVGRYRVSVLDPVHHIQIVDVLLDDVVAREPAEAIPVSQLVFHLRLAFSAQFERRPGAVPVGSGQQDVSDAPLLKPVDRLLIARFVAALQADRDGQLLALGQLVGGSAPFARQPHRPPPVFP